MGFVNTIERQKMVHEFLACDGLRHWTRWTQGKIYHSCLGIRLLKKSDPCFDWLNTNGKSSMF